MELLPFLSAFAVAAVGAAINSVAGGGTFLTFPVLMFLGYTPVQANVISTVALWPGTVASCAAYRREWWPERKFLPPLLLISALGSAGGAATLLWAPERSFEFLVPWLLLVATLLFAFGPRLIARMPRLHRPGVAHTMQLFTAFYGGYFGAGIGILMLAMLQLSGVTHIHRANALKTVLGTAINAVAVLMFIVSGAVVWDVALVMLAGAVLGGYAGAALAQKVPPRAVRGLVIAIGGAMTAFFFMK